LRKDLLSLGVFTRLSHLLLGSIRLDDPVLSSHLLPGPIGKALLDELIFPDGILEVPVQHTDLWGLRGIPGSLSLKRLDSAGQILVQRARLRDQRLEALSRRLLRGLVDIVQRALVQALDLGDIGIDRLDAATDLVNLGVEVLDVVLRRRRRRRISTAIQVAHLIVS
jgi:hypothetical protein